MSINSTDTTFFTNEEGMSLLDRFKSTLRDTQYFDVLVGYFRSSGFYQLYQSLENVERIRILVGLNVDRTTYQVVRMSDLNNYQIDFESHQKTKREFEKQLIEDIESNEENDSQLEIGIKKFIEFLQRQSFDNSTNYKGKQMEIRAYPSRDIHAKVYINRYNSNVNHIQYGSVITGSSNFSESGLVAQREFNVELKSRSDVDFALTKFEELWKDSVDISQEFVDAVEGKTWLNDQILPYELYLKCIYEYFEEEINQDDIFDPFLPKGFMELRYQKQAAIGAKKILETYNGVFLADVVGLGKTFIAALLLQQLPGRKLIICPPVLKDYWSESLRDFGVVGFETESLGKLESILSKDYSKYKYIVIDEAHRFRNQSTQSYANLLELCRDKKIILVTATPLNNSVDDIFSQLKLFQIPKASTIPGIPDLEKFFNGLKRKIKESKPLKDDLTDESKQEYRRVIKQVSDEIRDKVLKFVMIRRTRTDVKQYYQDDLCKQGISFPEVADPGRIVYQFEDHVEKAFNRTIELLKLFKYTRYIPLLYYNKKLTEFEKQQQRNVGGFMKGILVKRLESSFYAFKQSVSRFILSYEKFIDMYHAGTIYISNKADVYDLLDNDDFDSLEKLVEEEKAQKYISDQFGSYNGTTFEKDLLNDLLILKEIASLWREVNHDPKLEKFVAELKNNKILSEKKIVVFTESKETGDYLYNRLNKEFEGKVMFYSSVGGKHMNAALISKHSIARESIKANFDPKAEEKRNDIQILIATDVLAEGINLHRSNVLINYDLPWNPTRVLQRVGRVNRLGSSFKDILIYNFFPTTLSDVELGLEANITGKLQLFHYIMGEDAKYLSEGEEIGSQELFSKLNSKQTYSDEEESSELKYLELIRNLRDTEPDLFTQIKSLPKKARSGYADDKIEDDTMITFFRLGRLKKFYQFESGRSKEINFFTAVERLKCLPDTAKERVPSHYYQMLDGNRCQFIHDTTQWTDSENKGGGRSNAKFIENLLKDKQIRNYTLYTESDEEFINNIRFMLASGVLATKTIQIIKKEIERSVADQGLLDPMKVLHILQSHIKKSNFEERKEQNQYQKREIVLSSYILKK